MRIKMVLSALLVCLFVMGMSSTADAQRRRRWETDDERIYVPTQTNEHVVYDGDRILYERHFHGYKRRTYRRYYDKDYPEYQRLEHDRYYRRHHIYKYRYSNDYTKDR